jgi:hypothetical protein
VRRDYRATSRAQSFAWLPKLARWLVNVGGGGGGGGECVKAGKEGGKRTHGLESAFFGFRDAFSGSDIADCEKGKTTLSREY